MGLRPNRKQPHFQRADAHHREHVGTPFDGMIPNVERATGPQHLEWVSVPECQVRVIRSHRPSRPRARTSV